MATKQVSSPKRIVNPVVAGDVSNEFPIKEFLEWYSEHGLRGLCILCIGVDNHEYNFVGGCDQGFDQELADLIDETAIKFRKEIKADTN